MNHLHHLCISKTFIYQYGDFFLHSCMCHERKFNSFKKILKKDSYFMCNINDGINCTNIYPIIIDQL